MHASGLPAAGRVVGGFDGGGGQARNRLVRVACWLLSHGWFRGRAALAEPALTRLAAGLTERAEGVQAEPFVTHLQRWPGPPSPFR